jgi:hypothetical protein
MIMIYQIRYICVKLNLNECIYRREYKVYFKTVPESKFSDLSNGVFGFTRISLDAVKT